VSALEALAILTIGILISISLSGFVMVALTRRSA